MVGCLTSQQHASVSQGRICTDNFTCCHTEIEVADQTFYLTQSQYTDTGPTSPRADPISPGAWQGSHPVHGHLWLLTCYRLVGQVVKESASRVADPGTDSHFRRGELPGWSDTSDLKTGLPVATLPCPWRYRGRAGTGWPGVSMLWLGEVESLTCNFYLSTYYNCLSRSVHGIHKHVSGTLSSQPTNVICLPAVVSNTYVGLWILVTLTLNTAQLRNRSRKQIIMLDRPRRLIWRLSDDPPDVWRFLTRFILLLCFFLFTLSFFPSSSSFLGRGGEGWGGGGGGGGREKVRFANNCKPTHSTCVCMHMRVQVCARIWVS